MVRIEKDRSWRGIAVIKGVSPFQDDLCVGGQKYKQVLEPPREPKLIENKKEEKKYKIYIHASRHV